MTGKVGPKPDILLEKMGRLSFGSNHSDFKVSWFCLFFPSTDHLSWRTGPNGRTPSLGLGREQCLRMWTWPVTLQSLAGDSVGPCVDSGNLFLFVSPQGLLEPPLLGQTLLTEWIMLPLKTDKLTRWWSPLQLVKRAQPQVFSVPAFYSTFSVLGKLGDTFLHLSGWTKVLLMVVVEVWGAHYKKNNMGLDIPNLIRSLEGAIPPHEKLTLCFSTPSLLPGSSMDQWV